MKKEKLLNKLEKLLKTVKTNQMKDSEKFIRGVNTYILKYGVDEEVDNLRKEYVNFMSIYTQRKR
jgi:hypothetical protein